MEVDDHRLSWGDFEGVIPEGEYGAGAVIVWDRGSYRPLGDEPPERALEDGHLSFWLEGEKLRGGWTLRRLDSERSRAPRARVPRDAAGCSSSAATTRPTPAATPFRRSRSRS